MIRIPFSVAAVAASVALLATGASLSGCIVAAAGGGAVAGYAVVGEDLSPQQQMADYRIKADVQGAWGQFNRELAHRLTATVFNGQVLITGRVPDRRWREEAVRRARGVAGVRRVFDQMASGPDTHFIDSAHDAWIATQLRGEMIADMGIKSINYTIETNDGVVYVMGIARSQAELDRVIGHARTVAGVRRVTPFVTVMNSPEDVDVNGPPPGSDQSLPPDNEGDGNGNDDEDGAPPPASTSSPPPAPRGTIQAEPLK